MQPFKVGPDFIDPGHHTQAAGRVSRNLDGWMLSQDDNLALFRRHAGQAQVAVVEGVMGLFDGYDGLSEAGSTGQMAKWLGLPVLLVVDARSMARSAAALVHGFATFDPDLTLAGVVFNRDRRGRASALSPAGSEPVGGSEMPRRPAPGTGTGHPGKTSGPHHRRGPSPGGETPGALGRFSGTTPGPGRACWPRCRLPFPQEAPPQAVAPTVRLGVARDPAFCFYYPENLELLAHFGAELVPFSPLKDRKLPENLHGIYLGGGYPELFAAQLAANETLKRDLTEQAEAGLPIYAECGGLMYLSQEIEDLDGQPPPHGGGAALEGAHAAKAPGPGLPGDHPDGRRPFRSCGHQGPGP